jgi:hypothetical protein
VWRATLGAVAQPARMTSRTRSECKRFMVAPLLTSPAFGGQRKPFRTWRLRRLGPSGGCHPNPLPRNSAMHPRFLQPPCCGAFTHALDFGRDASKMQGNILGVIGRPGWSPSQTAPPSMVRVCPSPAAAGGRALGSGAESRSLKRRSGIGRRAHISSSASGGTGRRW